MQRAAEFLLDILKSEVRAGFEEGEARLDDRDEFGIVRSVARQVWEDIIAVSRTGGEMRHDG